jgi:hypothetical protein
MEENIMFSKKSLPISIALILLIALSTLGLAYGAWSDQLNINGTVTTGTFNVSMDYIYYDYDVAGCTAALSADGKTLTVTVANAYPGYHCGGGVSIRNLGTVPAKINGLVEVSNTVPAAFRGGAGLVFMNNPGVLAAGTTAGGVMWDFTIPATETGHEGESYTFSYAFLAEQAP